MSLEALTFMVLIGGFVWGGFVLLLVRAMRCEAGKSGASEREPGGS